MRIANAIRGLARLGEIDLFVVADGPWEPRPIVPPGIPVGRVEMVVATAGPPSVMRRVGWLTRGSLPKHFLGRDYRPARVRFGAWKAKRYDLVWLFRVQSYVALKPCLQAPTIVDLDDLEDYKAGERPALARAADHRWRPDIAHRLRRVVDRVQTTRDIRLFRGLHERITRSADAVVVCKELDRQRLGRPNVHVIPNGYEYQRWPVGRPSIGDPPVVMFPGVLLYPPNADGATYLVREILPLIWEEVPAVQVRLVGLATEEIQRLHRPPGVVITGFVQDIKTELAIADVIAVPLRYGGGTRVKILEAFAHRIPVVATAAGAEGIVATDGLEILIANTPRTFARACVRLLGDGELRRRMVDAAHRAFLATYRSDRVHDMVAALAAQIARGATATR